MKSLIFFCALLFLLPISIIGYAGVTADGTTAYRYEYDFTTVVFTDTPSEDPIWFRAPRGGGSFSSSDNTCRASTIGEAGVQGLHCSGTSGDSIETYTCELAGKGAPNASDTVWCLFSENPRIGGKAWAVKFVGGLIPSNDGDSIVRCQGTDVFHPDYGCWSPQKTLLRIEGGFMKMDTTDGNAPFGGDCTVDDHYGRMVVDEVGGKLYICTTVGWETITTD